MPVATADIKVDAVRNFGGEVLLHGANFDEAKAKAIELAQQQNFTWVPPFDHPMVIAGRARWRWSCYSRMHTWTACLSRLAAVGLPQA
ncbi:L-threonine dehydratase biosynthetic IlvA [Raoultella planticola]|uniref:L-threonine dehydratase biosynthetic IlvA n=1 Tax=Raoultella planticola TaxID=575 RepID=A0A485BHG1_RAOPL|nr:L-threonine dehydratase biosynthetic IlvA [Raoultella planticola]